MSLQRSGVKKWYGKSCSFKQFTLNKNGKRISVPEDQDNVWTAFSAEPEGVPYHYIYIIHI